MIGITLFFSFAFGAILLGIVILSLTFRQWFRVKFNKKSL